MNTLLIICIMKKSLMVAILLLPLALAKATSGSQIIPVPECFPCEEKGGGGGLTIATNIIPVPECFPCEEKGGGGLTIATNIIPVPECFPCEEKGGGGFATTARIMITPFLAIRREA